MTSPPIAGSSMPPSAARPSMSNSEKIAYYESVITQCRQQFYKQTLGNHVLKKRVRSTWKDLKKLRQSKREICQRSSDARQQLFKLTSEKIAQFSEELRALQSATIDTVGTALSEEAQLSARLEILKIASSEEIHQVTTASRHVQERWDKVREEKTRLMSRVAAKNGELDHIEGLRDSCKDIREKLCSENVHQRYEESYEEFTSVVRDLATEMEDKDKTLLELYTAKQLSINTQRAVTYPLRKEKALYQHNQEKLDCKLREARATLARLQIEIRELRGEERRCMTLGQAMSRLNKECQAKNATLGSLREQIEVSERKEVKECQQNHHRKEKTGKDKQLHRETENLKDMRRTLRSYQLVVAYCGTSSYRIRPEH